MAPYRLVLGIGIAAALVLALSLATTPAPEPPRGRRPTRGQAPVPRDGSGLRSYAFALPEIQGLSPDADPGTRLELWVTWGPPVSERPRIEPLMRDVVLERIVPPVTPGGPDAVILLVPEDEIGRLIRADHLGQLSATGPIE